MVFKIEQVKPEFIKKQKQIYGLRKSCQELINRIDDLQKGSRQVRNHKTEDFNKTFEGGR